LTVVHPAFLDGRGARHSPPRATTPCGDARPVSPAARALACGPAPRLPRGGGVVCEPRAAGRRLCFAFCFAPRAPPPPSPPRSRREGRLRMACRGTVAAWQGLGKARLQPAWGTIAPDGGARWLSSISHARLVEGRGAGGRGRSRGIGGPTTLRQALAGARRAAGAGVRGQEGAGVGYGWGTGGGGGGQRGGGRLVVSVAAADETRARNVAGCRVLCRLWHLSVRQPHG
jgi:hypothetical protein